MSTELTEYQPTAPDANGSSSTTLTEWVQNLGAAHQIATALCSTSFVPVHFRGKPDEAAAAILFGHEVGFSPTTSLQTLYVIGGKPAMYARPMVALVQSRGHEVWTEAKTDESVTVCGRRRGSDKVMSETWDIKRAQRAGYTNNKKYQSDPQAMLYARAASDVCRQVAADVLTGIGYSVEEMQLSGATEDSAPTAKPRGMDAVRQAVTPSAGQVTSEPPETVTINEDVQDAEVVEDVTNAVELISDSQRKAMFAAFTKAGFTTDARSEEGRTARLGYIGTLIGREIATSSDLTAAEASKVIDALNQDAAESGDQA